MFLFMPSLWTSEGSVKGKVEEWSFAPSCVCVVVLFVPKPRRSTQLTIRPVGCDPTATGPRPQDSAKLAAFCAALCKLQFSIFHPTPSNSQPPAYPILFTLKTIPKRVFRWKVEQHAAGHPSPACHRLGCGNSSSASELSWQHPVLGIPLQLIRNMARQHPPQGQTSQKLCCVWVCPVISSDPACQTRHGGKGGGSLFHYLVPLCPVFVDLGFSFWSAGPRVKRLRLI